MMNKKTIFHIRFLNNYMTGYSEALTREKSKMTKTVF